MTTKQTIAALQPLRADVSEAHQLVSDKPATGADTNACQRCFDHWRDSVRTYLAALADASGTVDRKRLTKQIAELNERLEAGFGMEVAGNTIEQWKIEKHFQKLLTELETCCDLANGHDATRLWLLAQDNRLRLAIRRNDQPTAPVDSYAGMEAR